MTLTRFLHNALCLILLGMWGIYDNDRHLTSTRLLRAFRLIRATSACGVLLLTGAQIAAAQDATLFGTAPPSATGGTPVEPDGNSGNLGMQFQSDAPGYVDGVRFYKGGPENGGTHIGALWTPGGRRLAQVTFTDETPRGWQTAFFKTPVKVAAHTSYIVSYFAPDGHYADNYELFRNKAYDKPPLHALSNPPVRNGLFNLDTKASFPTLNYLWSAYYVDVLFRATGLGTAATPEHFGKMFSQLKGFSFSDQQATDLAAAMKNGSPDPPGTNNGRADDSKTLAAWETYMLQFLDHNLDFDITQQPTSPINPDTLVNSSSGRFDLADVFSGGPSKDPRLYAADGKHLLVDCVLGPPLANGFPHVLFGNSKGACDFARNDDKSPVAADPRNDENQLVSQVTVAWMLFYNHLVDEGMTYAQARATTVNYYKLMIFDQLLPSIITDPGDISLYARRQDAARTWRITTPNVDGTFMPVEFSIGAFRFGHSLVRESYTVNDISPDSAKPLQNNVQVFDPENFQTGDLSGGAPLQGTAQGAAPGCQAPDQSSRLCSHASDHQIQWKYFDPALNAEGLDGGETNMSRQTAPTISPTLFNLPDSAIAGCPDLADPACEGAGALVGRDLARARYDGVPAGQDVARTLHCPVIPAASINPTHDSVFDRGTPLEYYVLAEAKRAEAPLGCVGSRVIAQVFLRALAGPGRSTYSEVTPAGSLTPVSGSSGRFTFEDLLIDVKLAPKSASRGSTRLSPRAATQRRRCCEFAAGKSPSMRKIDLWFNHG